MKQRLVLHQNCFRKKTVLDLGLSPCAEWILSFVQEMGVRADLQRSWFHPLNLFLSFLICEAKTGHQNCFRKWNLFFDLELEAHGGPITLTSNLNTEELKKLRLKDSFIKEFLTIWSETNFEDRILSVNHFLNQTLWHSSLWHTSPVFYPEWHYKGITKVKHLKDDSNNFLSPLELQAKFRHYGLISAL